MNKDESATNTNIFKNESTLLKGTECYIYLGITKT